MTYAIPDYREYTAATEADGTCTVEIRTSNGLQMWTVTQVSIEMESVPFGARVNLRLNGAIVSPMVPSRDTAGGDPPIILRPSDALTVTWSGCTPGAVGRATVFYTQSRY